MIGDLLPLGRDCCLRIGMNTWRTELESWDTCSSLVVELQIGDLVSPFLTFFFCKIATSVLLKVWPLAHQGLCEKPRISAPPYAPNLMYQNLHLNKIPLKFERMRIM